MASVPLKLCPTESIRITRQVCVACCQIKSQAHGAEVPSLTQGAESLHVHLYVAHIHRRNRLNYGVFLSKKDVQSVLSVSSLWFCVGSTLEMHVSWDVNLNVGGTRVSLMSAKPWAPGLASCFSWGWREGTGLVGRDLRGVLMWYLTARRRLIFLKKVLWAFWFWQPLAITQRAPCPAGLLSTTSPYTSAVAKKTGPPASGTGPSVSQWSQKYWSPYAMLY